MNYEKIPPQLVDVVNGTIDYMKTCQSQGFHAGFIYLQSPSVKDRLRQSWLIAGYDNVWRNPFNSNSWVHTTMFCIFLAIALLFVLTLGSPFFFVACLIAGPVALIYSIQMGDTILRAAIAQTQLDLMLEIGESLYANRDEIEKYGREVHMAEFRKLAGY